MDLQALKWTKNVRRHDGTWAYREYKVSNSFKLAWKDDEVNANKPEKGSLILLRQRGYVTHLVKVLDCKAKREIGVEVLWAIDFDNPPVSAKADAMFDYRVRYQGGNVMELEKLPTFRQRWNDDGGLGGFQTYIQNLLGLSRND
ncbi:hypothetical protein [Microcystis aeruginosa]|uniref:hypothetical protein n=1 Tax=Microcystis aeruginosa TaxID=1126 RepID=UPI0006282A4F|nr:hypothetical protein [Microcystis aeruginosa]